MPSLFQNSSTRRFAFAVAIVGLATCFACTEKPSVENRTKTRAKARAAARAADVAKSKAEEPVAAASQPAGATSQPAGAAPPANGTNAEGAERAAAAKKRLMASEAGRKVLRSIDYHGGLERFFGQGAMAFTYDYRPVGAEKKRRKSRQVVDVIRARAAHSLEIPTTGKFAFDGKIAWRKLDADIPFPARFWALTPYYFVALPFVLGDAGVKLALSKDTPTAAGFKAADVIAVTFEDGTGDASGDTYHLYLDPTSGRLLGTRYTVTYAPFFAGKKAKRSPEKLIHYSDEKTIAGLKFAHTQTFYAYDASKGEAAKGAVVTNAVVTDLAVATKYDDEIFSIPKQAIVDDALEMAAK